MVKLKMSRVVLVGLVTLLLVVMPLMGACAKEEPAPAPTPTPTPEPTVEKPIVIKVGYTHDLHVAYADICRDMLQGQRDTIAKINAEGGIDGVPLELHWMDCGQDPALALSAYERFKQEGCLIMGSVSSAHAVAIRGLASEDMFPIMNQAQTVDVYFPADPVVWIAWNHALVHILSPLKYFDEAWQREYGDEPWKLGILIWNHPMATADIPGIEAWCENHNVEIVGIEKVSPAAKEFKTELARLKAAEPDAIFTSSVSTWLILRDADELGMLPGLEITQDTKEEVWHDGITFLTDLFGGVAYGREVAGDLVKYLLVGTSVAWTHEDDTGKPELKFLKDSMIASYGQLTPDSWVCYLIGYLSIRGMDAAIRQTIEEVGWENLTHENVCKALPGIVLDPGGLTGSQSWADYPDDHTLNSSTRVARFNLALGEYEAITDWFNADRYGYDEGVYDVYLKAAGITEWPTEYGGKTWPERVIE